MDTEKILVVYGTRPEEIKLYPFAKYKRFVFCEVDQSHDLHQGLIKPTFKVAEAGLEDFIKKHKFKAVMVQGDTRTTFRAALYAFEMGLPVIHIEAGLRTWDLKEPFPEEGYRQMIDCIATYKFCSRPEAAKNCDGIYVGQTGIDTLFEFVGRVRDSGYYIVTVHRNESFDRIDWIIKVLKEHQKTKDLVIFAHPNKVGQELRKHFETYAPMNYLPFVDLLSGCRGVISDSGGLQEEAIALGKSFISLRGESERSSDDVYKKGATKKIVNYLDKAFRNNKKISN